MAAGVTSDASNIYIYDDTHADAGGDGSYSFVDIHAILGGTGVDITRVDSGSAYPTYRLFKNLQIGDTGTGTATTTLKDSNVVAVFDAAKVLQTRTTQASSWNIEFGSKIDTGDQAGGGSGAILCFTSNSGSPNITWRGTVLLYGTTLRARASAGNPHALVLNTLEPDSEIMNCIFDGLRNCQIGTATTPFDNVFNLDISNPASTAALVNAFLVNSAERLTFSASPAQEFMQSGQTGVTIKDFLCFGVPGRADFRWTSSLSEDWKFIQPHFSNSAPRFSAAVSGLPAIGDATLEYWKFRIKVVDRNGNGISGIPTTLTDTTGVVQITTTTDSNGEISFGSGITANFIVVRDHYVTVGAATYSWRDRSPFTLKVNTSDLSGYNPNYLGRKKLFYWPGYESSQTDSSSDFQDVFEISALEDPSGQPTAWTECTI